MEILLCDRPNCEKYSSYGSTKAGIGLGQPHPEIVADLSDHKSLDIVAAKSLEKRLD